MRHVYRPGFQLRSVLLASLSAATLAVAAPAQAAGERAINLPAGSLEASLAALASQTGEQLAFPHELVAGKRAPAVSGRLTVDQALTQLLANTDIDATRAGPKLVVLKRQVEAAARANPVGAAPAWATRPFGAQVVQQDASPEELRSGDRVERAIPPVLVDEVRVTGTFLRGGSPAAPVVALERSELERTGHATIAAALQTLPQNFGGEAAEGTVTTRADRLGSNASYGTSVNLRGLGADATLVLVNGRRMAGSGNKGDFADLSNIPLVAVQRVEVLLDGASALYGSDAVGGVVNVILRRDYSGAEVRVRAGRGEGGTPREGVVGAVVGQTWESGSVLLALEASRREALAAADRRFANNSDLRPLGGSDQRDTFSFPGNIVRTDPATGGTTPFWAIPPGQPGVGLRPTDFQPSTINRYNQTTGVDLLPDQRRQAAYLALRQEVAPRLELSGDVRYGFRRAKVAGSGTVSTLTVGRNNPFFVSPNGAASNQIQYAFSAEGGNLQSRVTAESLAITAGADAELAAGWKLQSYLAFAQEIIESKQTGAVHTTILAEALGNTPDNPATAYNAARDGFFNPYSGTVGANSPGTLAAILSGSAHSRFRSRVSSANVQADGRLFDLPGGEVQLALGAQARREAFARGGSNYLTQPVWVPGQSVVADRTVLSLFGEVRVPLVGPDNRRAGIERLEISGAVRGERYSDFGRTVNPRLGVQWSPTTGLTLRGTYGQSFRAPALTELGDPASIASIILAQGASRLRVVALQGGNPGLDPETAESWTLGFDLQPAAIPGLKVSATWFRTDFDNRIDRPLVSNRAGALVDPRLTTFVERVSPGTNAADLARVVALLADPRSNVAPGTFPPTDIAAIIDQRWVNTAGLRVSGIDAQVQYAFAFAAGRLTLAGNASRLLDYKEAITPAAPFVDLIGQAGYPAKFRARLSADWVRGDVGVGFALNHLGGFSDQFAGNIRAQTTIDFNARIEFPERSRLAGTTATVTVRNLFDRAPPFYDNPIGYAFDAASSDPIGRFIAIQLTRSW
ncbi:MAG: TonB-dependent receptor [Phenylobacterium sp.]|uniref:TonB-dependent receptor n=1 Tax=Phenylobacterium sp. TaxID=1871053 RepID=UPI001A263A49|nr:TonB-dependent receptor [Phenylobacterium sp.]MBJ7411233.1 TonB-dependent receptor [Phenylobacterium sp.]